MELVDCWRGALLNVFSRWRVMAALATELQSGTEMTAGTNGIDPMGTPAVVLRRMQTTSPPIFADASKAAAPCLCSSGQVRPQSVGSEATKQAMLRMYPDSARRRLSRQERVDQAVSRFRTYLSVEQ